jgi:hypothetical protein
MRSLVNFIWRLQLYLHIPTAIGIATDFRVGGRLTRVWVPVKLSFVTSPCCPDLLTAHLQPVSLRVRDPITNWILYIDLILLVVLGSEAYSESNRNTRDRNKKVSVMQSAASVRGWKLQSQLCANCLDNVRSSTSHNPIDLYCLLRR